MRASLGLSGFREPVLRHRELMFIEILVRGRTLCIPSRPRGDPGGGCHRWRAAKVQSSSGVTGRLTRSRPRVSPLQRPPSGGRSLGASGPGVSVPASARLASANPRGSILSEKNGLLSEVCLPALCAPSGASAHTHTTRPSLTGITSCWKPSRTGPSGGRSPGSPDTHPAPCSCRLFPAGDSVRLPTRVGPSP